jgi:DEAD/DEAH box helicase domain-containing protein
MPVHILLARPFDTTHERTMFDDFADKLKSEFGNQTNQVMLIGNLHVGGKELDAVVFKKDAITIFEFKNYGGALTFYENGPWPITSINNGVSETISVKGGSSVNPYIQVRQNKFALIEILNLFSQFTDTNLGHISGVVLFARNIEFDVNFIPPKISSWFHISDLNNVIKKINQLTSASINLSDETILGFKHLFNLSDNEFYSNDNITDEDTNISSSTPGIADSNVISIGVPLINSANVSDILTDANINFEVVYKKVLPARQGQFIDSSDLKLQQATNNYLNSGYKGRIYLHQFKALEILNADNDNNVCLSTSTSSGKSLVFYAQAFDIISKDPQAKILAIYPLKALGYQQEEKWRQAIDMSGMNIKVGRIDGTIPTNDRTLILDKCNIIVVTPDVLHAWFFSNLGNKVVQKFFRNLSLIIIDEVHIYRGVFGSNAAYLFRRINFATAKLKLTGSKPVQYLCASATINNPDDFLHKLTGLQFNIIDQEYESSPKHEIEIYLLDSQNRTDPYSQIASLINKMAEDVNNRSITFIDNRKSVEYIATIAARLQDNNIFPYRSGYEVEDRISIQDKLNDGSLRGVISTSALEMGIDIGHLNIGILFGVPSSQTSFMQRIGRIGRQQPGKVFIINDKSIRSERIFNNPSNIFNIPPADTALYLENEFIQYIHALCMVGIGGSSETEALGNSSIDEVQFAFPPEFISLCNRVVNSSEPQYLKALNNGDSPHYAFPLRDIERQFKIELVSGKEIIPLGDMTKSQQMREAYPGAVYYHMKNPYRVNKIESNKIKVRNEAHYFTRPMLQIMPYPNIDNGLIEGKRFANTTLIECNLDVYENIFGYYEKKGGADEIPVQYPNQYFSRKTYSRRIISTGVIIGQGPLSDISSAEKVEAIAYIFFNVFLTNIPFEPQDLNYCIGSFSALNNAGIFNAGDKYICIYDKTYGSLRLTSRLMIQEVLLGSINSALEWINTADRVFTKDGEEVMIDEEIRGFFHHLREDILKPESPLSNAPVTADNRVPILAPNQEINRNNNDTVYIIDHVYAQQLNGISTIFYELKNILTGDIEFEIPQSDLAVTPQHIIVQFDLIRNKIIA